MKASSNIIIVASSGGAILGGSIAGPIGAVIGAIAGATIALASDDDSPRRIRRREPAEVKRQAQNTVAILEAISLLVVALEGEEEGKKLTREQRERKQTASQ